MNMSNSIFDWLNLIAGNVWLYGGAFFLVLGVLVFVHEWGHYYVAKLCGVKVESFSVGFGKELFGFTDKAGTRWKFSLVPLGGYVKMFGDVDPASAKSADGVAEEDSEEIRPFTEEEKGVAFFSQPVLKRAAIVFAGPAINFIFAILIMFLLYTFYGKPITPPLSTSVIVDSAAYEAGFEPHDKILEIDGKEVLHFEDIRRAVAVGLDKTRVFTVLRDGEEVRLSATPKVETIEDRFGFKHTKGFLGIISPGNAIDISKITKIDDEAVQDVEETRAMIVERLGQPFTISMPGADGEDRLLINPLPSLNKNIDNGDSQEFNVLVLESSREETFLKLPMGQAFTASLVETKNITVSTMEALGQIFVGSRSATELGGIIRIGAIAGDMAKSGFIALVAFTALLSINLGLINLFPIPMLDGGHLVFYAVESIKGSPLSETVQEYAFRVGLVILVGVMLFANLNDIVQLIR